MTNGGFGVARDRSAPGRTRYMGPHEGEEPIEVTVVLRRRGGAPAAPGWAQPPAVSHRNFLTVAAPTRPTSPASAVSPAPMACRRSGASHTAGCCTCAGLGPGCSARSAAAEPLSARRRRSSIPGVCWCAESARRRHRGARPGSAPHRPPANPTRNPAATTHRSSSAGCTPSRPRTMTAKRWPSSSSAAATGPATCRPTSPH